MDNSSTTSPTSSFNDFPTPSPSQGPPNGNPPANRGANYFFGFLITFIALLLLFIGCGIGTRRRLQRRRGLLDLGGWGDSHVDIVPKEEPKLLEPAFVQGGGTWSTIQPLATSLIPSQSLLEFDEPKKTSSSSSNSSSRPEPPVRMPSPNPIAYHGLSLPVWSRTSRTSKSNNEGESKAEEEPISYSMQIAVMISMPHAPSVEEITREDEQQLPEYQLGVAHSPWEEGRTALT